MTIYPSEAIKRVSIIDDDPDVRSSYKYPVEDASYEPIERQTLKSNVEATIESIQADSDAVLTDYQLQIRNNYSRFNGAQLAAGCYQRKIPVILCTRFNHTVRNDIRKYRRLIPILLNPGDLNAKTLRNSFEICRRELEGEFLEERRPWRTLVRVEDSDVTRSDGGVAKKTIYLIIPGWEPGVVIDVEPSLLSPIPVERLEPGFRFHANINTGAQKAEDLYITDVEP